MNRRAAPPPRRHSAALSRRALGLAPGLIALGLLTACAAAPEIADELPVDPVPADFKLSFQAGLPVPDLAPVRLDPETVLIEDATIFTGAGPRIEHGSILLVAGRIVEVGPGPITAPKGTARIDAAGRFITPGLIDSHSHLGVYPAPTIEAHSDGNEATGPVSADVRAEHSLWPQDPGLQRALEGGVTTAQILPGSANLIGGRGVTIKFHPAISSRAMRFPDAPWGLKMACGENPKRVYGSKGARPSTRVGSMAVWRTVFQRAAENRASLEAFEKNLLRWKADPKALPAARPIPPPRDLSMETLVAAMDGDILVHVHCYRADEMIQMMELAGEFGFSIRSFHHAVEAYKIRDVLAAYDVAVSTWADWWGFKAEAHDAIVENAALISVAGARAIIHSDSAIGIQRLNQEAAKALYRARDAGIPVTEEDAIRWITANPAWALGVQDRVGTLEPGKMADVVVWSRHPLSVYARPELVFVDGVREFDAAAANPPWSDFEVEPLPASADAPSGEVPHPPALRGGR